ncbi:CYTH and CHAD domain-containing protein [Propionivibrio limicola]|uniref:CYTH and CHAD domain-containing protein n=1 Tax=Propionivibrio limicola TaxID=167645 RepID=UPI001290F89B|nr:CYTH and CHAD domain-containing protein [Propionivibrio limicola]
MPTEIELKLRLSPAEARQLIKHRLLVATPGQKFRLFNTYYDTPDSDLRKQCIALRLRRKGWSSWLITVKGSDPNGGALAQRREWEAPTQPGVFDLSIVTDEGLREFLECKRALLQPVFSTDFTRITWRLERARAVVEVALDRGEIKPADGGGKSSVSSEPICELELELLSGDSPDALFEIAIELAQDFELHPEILSKAERGYLLAGSEMSQPAKAVCSPINSDMSAVDAFRAIALSCVLHLQRNEGGAIAGSQPEYLHQARVAIRRLRSAFKVFAPVLMPAFIDVYAPRWGASASRLGGARDWDVFLSETLAPLEDAFPANPDLAALRTHAETAQGQAQAAARIALKEKEYSQLLLAFLAALFRVEPPTIEQVDARPVANLHKFASRRLARRAGVIERIINERGKMSAERRHQLRIAFKKLRYALDFFAPILGGRRLVAYQASLSALQDLLGTLNDQETASRLIMEMQPEGKSVPLLKGWIAGRKHLLVSALDKELGRFMTLKQPW